MKVVILDDYFDKGLNKKVKSGDVLDLDDDRIEALMSAGIDVAEYDEDLDNETSNAELIESYKNDKNIVDDLKADDLKIICDSMDIRYTNAKEIREHLKNHEPLKDKEQIKNELIESYKNDKNIVDGLEANDLEVLCEEFGVSYTNEADSKEALKIVTIS